MESTEFPDCAGASWVRSSVFTQDVSSTEPLPFLEFKIICSSSTEFLKLLYLASSYLLCLVLKMPLLGMKFGGGYKVVLSKYC